MNIKELKQLAEKLDDDVLHAVAIQYNIKSHLPPYSVEAFKAGFRQSEDKNLPTILSLLQRLSEAEAALRFYDSIEGWDAGSKTGESSYKRAREYFKRYEK